MCQKWGAGACLGKRTAVAGTGWQSNFLIGNQLYYRWDGHSYPHTLQTSTFFFCLFLFFYSGSVCPALIMWPCPERVTGHAGAQGSLLRALSVTSQLNCEVKGHPAHTRTSNLFPPSVLWLMLRFTATTCRGTAVNPAVLGSAWPGRDLF